ncbi:MAG TPA: TldD/PmbA family protein [Gemmatimonadaceae bacterium]|nr:TldD/PmbA family protein [Gemmatimonadaceae bacterium]
MTSRRDFLKATTAATLAAGLARPASAQGPASSFSLRADADPALRELLMEALQAAKDAGASYADARAGRYRRQFIATREQQVTGINDSESFGVGVRVLVDGAWGFAGTSTLTREGMQLAAREAARIARAGKSARRKPVELAPVTPATGSWRTPIAVDPIEIAIEDKVALLLAANAAALKVPKVRFVNSSLAILREEKTLATTDGTLVTQTFVRVGPGFTATAIESGDFQSYTEELAPRGAGWEYVTGLDMPGNAERWASLAAEKLSARSVDVGRYDLILDPRNLWLTIHESIGHPTELDRAMGQEANYAGTSFVAPPSAMIGKLKYGPEFMNVQADRTQPNSLAQVGWDDEGVPAGEWLIVDKGTFKDYQTTREQAAWISNLTGVSRSHGCSFAQSWGDVQFQRMPNISLMPGEQDIGLDEIVADTERGVVVKNRGSWSIDQQRYNFQFSGQVAYEVKKGKITGMLKDVAYQSRTPEFWNSMDMIGGKSSYWLGGTFSDGKGEPGQASSTSHGCPPARFRNVNIVNTGRTV